MRSQLQTICFGLTVGTLASVLVACQGAPDTAQSPTATSPPDDTEQPAASPEAEQPQATATEDPTETTEPAATTATQPNTAGTAPVAEEPTAQSSQPVPPLPAECSNPQTQMDMNRCAEAEYNQADAELNNAYQTVQATLSNQQGEQLTSAEQAWIAYRDLYCEFVQSQFAGGSIQPMVYYGCLTQLTKDRTAELKQNTSASMGFEAADQQLNTVYQDLQGYLSPEEQDLLTDAQLEWISYRDAHCAFEGGDTNTCLAQVTETRVRQLQEQLDTRSL